MRHSSPTLYVAAALVAGSFVAAAAVACTTTTTVVEPDSPNAPTSSGATAPTAQASATPTVQVSVNLPPDAKPGDWVKPNPNGKANGDGCTKPDDCKSGVCEGEGCSTGPKCVDAGRMCTRDLVFFCGCDGASFSGSGTCPGRPYKSRGNCK